MLTVLRAVTAHKPDFIFGDGQGGLIALGLSSALCLEACLSKRNVQLQEAIAVARRWGAIKGIFAYSPRVHRTKLDLEHLKLAVPELFVKKHP